MTRGPRLLLLGKQGAGKGTQAARLADHYRVVHLSTGELFRAAVRAGTHYGLLAQPYLDGGNLVPDELVIGMVEERFSNNGELDDGFVLDGFPRTSVQAEELARILGDDDLDVVLHLDVADAVVLDRLAGRRTCTGCGHVYHIDHPPQHGWTCDLCGSDVVQREDDTEAAIERRLELYHSETLPLLDFYEAKGLLVTIPGVGTTDDVFRRLIDIVDTKRAPAIG